MKWKGRTSGLPSRPVVAGSRTGFSGKKRIMTCLCTSFCFGDSGGMPVLNGLSRLAFMVSPLSPVFPDVRDENLESVARVCRGDEAFCKRKVVCKPEWKKAYRLRCTPFLGGQNQIPDQSAGTESVSRRSCFLEFVHHAELNASDAILVGTIASQIAGHGFPFIIGMRDHTVK